jgi:hypothetical protein
MAPRLRRRPSLFLLAACAAGLSSLSATITIQPALAESGGPGAKGAQVYCFMRGNGNDHATSWSAAYALIKRQGGSMFKTSPEHAAVMITEAVVQNPASFPECGRYLGDLYSRKKGTAASGPTPLETNPAPAMNPAPGGAGGSAGGGGLTRSERYN